MLHASLRIGPDEKIEGDKTLIDHTTDLAARLDLSPAQAGILVTEIRTCTTPGFAMAEHADPAALRELARGAFRLSCVGDSISKRACGPQADAPNDAPPTLDELHAAIGVCLVAPGTQPVWPAAPATYSEALARVQILSERAALADASTRALDATRGTLHEFAEALRAKRTTAAKQGDGDAAVTAVKVLDDVLAMLAEHGLALDETPAPGEPK